MSEFKEYTNKKSGKKIEARPYVSGEDLKGVQMHDGAQIREGSMICREVENPKEMWYMYEGAFRYHYGEPQ